MQDLAVPLHHICESHGQTGIQKWIVGTQACLLAQQSVTTKQTRVQDSTSSKNHDVYHRYLVTVFHDIIRKKNGVLPVSGIRCTFNSSKLNLGRQRNTLGINLFNSIINMFIS
jgi:hypothetical protein